MSVYKHVELTAEAGSIEEAIRLAAQRSHEAVRHQSWLEVKEIRANLNGGQIDEFQVTVDLAFRDEES